MHDVPQAPQLLLSVFVFTHELPHSCWPPGQVQPPAEQVDVPGQESPQLWQFALVPIGLPSEQRQLPLVQLEPPSQVLLHAPQCASLVFRFWHPDTPQSVSPVPQLQSPFEQALSAGQLFVHDPQYASSLEMSRHAPSQKSCPDGHTHEPF